MLLSVSLATLVRSYETEIICGLVALNFLMLFVLLHTVSRMSRLTRLHRRLMRSTTGGDLEDRLFEFMDAVTQVGNRSETTEQRVCRLEENQRGCLQHVGMVRFDAFEEVGGQQSFAIAVTDEARNGFVLSSVYSRADVRIYAKSIESGRPSHPLSVEEQSAMARAEGG